MRGDHTLSNAEASAKRDTERMEVTVRNRRTLFAGFLANLVKERLPRRVMFGEPRGVKGYTPRAKRG